MPLHLWLVNCRQVDRSAAEYRKRTVYNAREAGFRSLLPWLKRNLVQSFQFFCVFSVPGSFNVWTPKAHEKAEPRREEACAICAVKDWLENRHDVCLFKEASSMTTWSTRFYTTVEKMLATKRTMTGVLMGAAIHILLRH